MNHCVLLVVNGTLVMMLYWLGSALESCLPITVTVSTWSWEQGGLVCYLGYLDDGKASKIEKNGLPWAMVGFHCFEIDFLLSEWKWHNFQIRPHKVILMQSLFCLLSKWTTSLLWAGLGKNATYLSNILYWCSLLFHSLQMLALYWFTWNWPFVAF